MLFHTHLTQLMKTSSLETRNPTASLLAPCSSPKQDSSPNRWYYFIYLKNRAWAKTKTKTQDSSVLNSHVEIDPDRRNYLPGSTRQNNCPPYHLFVKMSDKNDQLHQAHSHKAPLRGIVLTLYMGVPKKSWEEATSGLIKAKHTTVISSTLIGAE